MRKLFTLIPGAVVLALAILTGPSAFAQEPLLEKYTLESTGHRSGLAYQLYDQSLGGGDAHTRIELRRNRSAATLLLRVWRQVRPGNTALALLGERVEVRCYDLEGTLIFSRDFVGLEDEGIYFLDSRSGNWQRRLTGIPLDVRRVEVTFIGNYE